MPTTHDGLHFEFSDIEGVVEVIYDASRGEEDPDDAHHFFEFSEEYGFIEHFFIW